MIAFATPVRRFVLIVIALSLAGCGGHYTPAASGYSLQNLALKNPASVANTPACTKGCLYVADTYENKWLEYGPPFSSSSKPLFGKSLGSANAIAADSLYLATTGQNVNRVKMYHLPDTSGSNIYFASMALGGPPVYVAFDKSHDVWVANSNNQIEEFAPPFSSSSHHVRVVTHSIVSPFSIAFDNSNNLYVGQSQGGDASGPVQILRFTPPYTGSPQIYDPGIFPLGMAIHNSTLVVTGEAAVGIANCNCARFNVFTLPLTSSSKPVSVDVNEYGIPGSPAFDASGNLYVPIAEALHSAPPGVIMYRPPFTSSNHGAFDIHIGLQVPAAAAIGP